MKAGLAKRLVGELVPYGISSMPVCKDQRSQGGLKWFDYVIHFGLSRVPRFGVGFDRAGEVSGLSFSPRRSHDRLSWQRLA